jgi:hypothetical protein
MYCTFVCLLYACIQVPLEPYVRRVGCATHVLSQQCADACPKPSVAMTVFEYLVRPSTLPPCLHNMHGGVTNCLHCACCAFSSDVLCVVPAQQMHC